MKSFQSAKDPWVFRISGAIGLLLAVMYFQSAWVFIVSHRVDFIGYSADTPLAQWAVANLGARLIGIGIGFVVAVWLRSSSLLALAFLVRLSADICDLLISSTTSGVAPSVAWVLLVFVIIEAVCLVALVRDGALRSNQ